MKIVDMQWTRTSCLGLCFAFGVAGTACLADQELDAPETVHSAAISIDPNASYTIVGVQSNKCVGIADGSLESDARLEIQTCVGQSIQRFRPEAMGGGFFRLRNERSGLCVDVRGISPFAGAQVIQFACSNGPNQQWSFTDVAGGAERITVRHSGQVMDVTLRGTADGTPIEQWPSNGDDNQRFVLAKALPPFAPE